MKKLIALLLALCMVFTLVACGSKTENPAAETSANETTAEKTQAEGTSASEGKEDVTLYVYMQDIDAIDAWNELIANFQAEYPWITLELMDSQENYFSTILATGDMPDFVNPAMSEVARAMVDAGLIGDISGTVAYSHLPEAYQAAETYNGVCIGVPQGTEFSTIFYNMQILEAAGWTTTPTNREEFLQCCADVKAAGYEALTLAGDKTTCCFMLYECILANEAGAQLGSTAAYDDAFRNGTLDFTAYPEATKLLGDIAAYIMPGTTANTEDDVVSAMASGNVAMCLAGNWSAGNICSAVATATGDDTAVAATLPPFNAVGEECWISVSPESVIGMSGVDEGEAHNEARVMFYEYLWEPENYAILQNARGCVPVLDNMSADLIQLDAAIAAIVPDVSAAPYVSMGFNSWSAEFSSVACTALNDVYAGNSTADAAANTMWSTLQTSNMSGS